MKQLNKITNKLEQFVKDHSGDLKKAKDAFSKKNWEDYCKTMQPVLKKAEDLGMLAKGNVKKLYSHTKEEAVDFYKKASHLAKDAEKLYADNADEIKKTCSDEAKEFFSDLKKISTDVFEDGRVMAQEIANEAHKHGKPLVIRMLDCAKAILAKICNKIRCK